MWTFQWSVGLVVAASGKVKTFWYFLDPPFLLHDLLSTSTNQMSQVKSVSHFLLLPFSSLPPFCQPLSPVLGVFCIDSRPHVYQGNVSLVSYIHCPYLVFLDFLTMSVPLSRLTLYCGSPISAFLIAGNIRLVLIFTLKYITLLHKMCINEVNSVQ